MATSEIEQSLTLQTFFSNEEENAILKCNNLLIDLKKILFERDEILEVMFIALLCRNHVIMIGPPGIAKSYLIECFCKGLEKFSYFQRQLTKFSTPEEVFGPYSLPKLKEGLYERITTGKLAESEIVYIDEIFNANSSILNSLNQALNERVFEGKKIPLESTYGATNFTPEEKETMAFFDRFLFRFIVDDIYESNNFGKMLVSPEYVPNPKYIISKKEIKLLQDKVSKISILKIIPKIIKLRELLRIEMLEPSSRRFKWAIKALQAKALLEGRSEVIDEDLYLLKHILWNDKTELSMVESVILKSLDPAAGKIKELYDQAVSVQKSIKGVDVDDDDDGYKKIKEACGKLKEIAKKMQEITDGSTLLPKSRGLAENIINKVRSLFQKIVDENFSIETI